MRFKFDPTVTAGNLVQTILIVFGIGAGWANLNNRVDTSTKEIKHLNEVVTKISDTQNKVSENLKVLTAIVDERTVNHGRVN